MTMKVDGKLTEDPQLIANTFNSFFVKTIVDLKSNIDPNFIKDPLENLKENMSSKKCKFELKTVSIKSLKQSIKQLKAKKSAGYDGLTQSQLKVGVSVLASPLQNIIKKQIKSFIKTLPI